MKALKFNLWGAVVLAAAVLCVLVYDSFVPVLSTNWLFAGFVLNLNFGICILVTAKSYVAAISSDGEEPVALRSFKYLISAASLLLIVDFPVWLLADSSAALYREIQVTCTIAFAAIAIIAARKASKL